MVLYCMAVRSVRSWYDYGMVLHGSKVMVWYGIAWQSDHGMVWYYIAVRSWYGMVLHGSKVSKIMVLYCLASNKVMVWPDSKVR